MRSLIITLLGLIVISAPVMATEPWNPCYSDLAVSCPGMRISTCPRGSFEDIADGCGNGDDYIEIIIRSYGGDAIKGIPPTDYWINACDEQYELCLCVQHIVADSVTGSNGRTTFSGSIAAGGCVPEGGIWMSCQGRIILDLPYCNDPTCLDVVIVGPDINADCVVDLSDLSYFGDSYNTVEGKPDRGFNTCCDFTDDGACDLSDFSLFGDHYLHQCW